MTFNVPVRVKITTDGKTLQAHVVQVDATGTELVGKPLLRKKLFIYNEDHDLEYRFVPNPVGGTLQQVLSTIQGYFYGLGFEGRLLVTFKNLEYVMKVKHAE